MSKVTIENHNNRLRLRWWYQEKRYTLAVGMPDSVVGHSRAKQIAGQIEQDIATGHFDPTLLAYKPRRLGKTRTELTCPELFEAFTQAMSKEKELAPGTLEKYRAVSSHLLRLLNFDAQTVTQKQACKFQAALVKPVSSTRKPVSPTTAKIYLGLLKACWDWAVGKYHVTEVNPWQGLAAKIKAPPRQKTKPLPEVEVKLILAALKTNRYYSHYFPMTRFLFGTGCRFGEMAALKWKHLSQDFSVAWIGESISRGHHRPNTKTDKPREIVLSPSLVAMLQTLHEKRKPRPDDLIFPAPRGGAISDKNFRRGAWKKMLDQLGIDYRKPYSTRHTAASHALAAGADPLQVASQCGHNPKILYQNYASVIQSKSIFKEF